MNLPGGQPSHPGQPGQGVPLQQPPQQPQRQQYQQHQQQQRSRMSHQGLNGGWQSDRDVNERRKMIAKIVQLLQQRKPNAPQEWLNKLPQMAKRLEESLYRSAPSFEAYKDVNTLKQRLQQLAMNIGMKTKNAQAQRAAAQQKAAQQGQMPGRPPPQYQQQQQPMQRQPQMTSSGQPMQQAVPTQQQQGGSRQMVNMADINPMAGRRQGGAPQQPMSSSGAPQQRSSSNSGSSRKISDRQQVLRHQQQRLLLLRHAAKCPHEDGRCPVTPHCAGMKRLWKHIAECKDQKCLVPHCVSSRYVLSHYHRCKDVRCPVCGPVREAIHRSHEKQKQMQAMKQQGQPVAHYSKQGSTQKKQGSATKRRKTASGMVPGAVPSQQGGYNRPPHHQPLAKPPGAPQYGYNRGMPPQQGAGGARGFAGTGLAYKNGQIITPRYSGPKPQEDHTLINCFSVAQIELHIESLNNGLQLTPQKLKTKAGDALKVLMAHQHGWVFNTPVDPVELGLPDYFQVIKKPMDLGSIKKRLENGCYHSVENFREDVNLTFENAMVYNPEGSVVYNMAKEMLDKFAKDYENLIKQLIEEEDAKRKSGDSCTLCGCEKLLFEPPVFYCNGARCPSKRIRRNSYYYVGGNNQYHWCHVCYGELKEANAIELADVTLRKSELLKKKNDEVHEESWVQCDTCERWIHQICALFNTRQNKDQRSEYTCPKCTVKERKKKGKLEATSTTPMAEDLPRTLLSEYVETHVRKRVDFWLERAAAAKMKKENISAEEAKKAVALGGAITIRQVASLDRKLEVRDRMKKRYAFKDYPDEFNFRGKCIVVFQNLDGVDTLLFGLYVYEHDHKNPAPNTRAVYVSYLDSVYYMRPRKMRTYIYHEILISYLDYVRKRGFSTAHIWACPPLKGDDYILYAKPEDQKTPRDDRLRQWYADMLFECQKRGICERVTNMYDLYFSDPKNTAAIVPYMEGDYFPAEVENIIKEIEEGKPGKGKKTSSDGKSKKKKNSKKGNRGGTRSSGIDEDALKASGIIPEGVSTKSLEDGGRDYVMTKLGETIQPMKESFLVAFLNWKGIKEENREVSKKIIEYRKLHGIEVGPGEPAAAPSIELAAFAADKAAAEQKDTKPADAGEANDDGKAKDDKPKTDGESDEAKSDEAKSDEVKSDEAKSDETKSKGVPSDEAKGKDGKSDDAKMDEAKSKDGKSDEGKIDDDKSGAAKSGEAKSGDGKSDDAKSKETKGDDTKTDEAKSDDDKSDDDKSKDPTSKDAKADETKSEGLKTDDAKTDKSVTTTVDEEEKKADVNDGENPFEAKASKDGVKTEESDSAEPMEVDEKDKNDGAEMKNESDGGDAKMTDADAGAEGAVKEGEKKEPEKTLSEESKDKPGGTEPMETEKVDAEGPTPTKSAEEKKDVPDDAKSSGEVASAPRIVTSEATDAGNDANASPSRGGKFAAMAAKKRDADGNIKADAPPSSKAAGKAGKGKKKEGKDMTVKDSKGRTVKVLDDDDEELDCEFLNNRQLFLNLCQGNHYQFDHLRRAKHSSMMVLWHLHNRDAPKFVQQCGICSREILAGYRYHCPTCTDFDLCQECFHSQQQGKIPRHPHQLKAIAVTQQQQQLTEEQRKERQRSIQLHMTLLLHAATCTAPKCPSANCTKMKGLLKHGATCQVKANGGCHICKRIWALLQIHARQCKNKACPVPNCTAIRERFRQLKMQQQAMDDRRRQEMNRAYRGGR